MLSATKQDASSKLDGAFLISLLSSLDILVITENTLFTFEINYCPFGGSMIIPNVNSSF